MTIILPAIVGQYLSVTGEITFWQWFDSAGWVTRKLSGLKKYLL